MDYKSVVLSLLKRKQYPVLLDYVIIDIYYKTLKPKCPGKQYFSPCNCPEVIFERENEANKIVYMTTQGNYFLIYKEDIKNIDLKNLELQCKKIKINKGFINKILKTEYTSFEEELYKFITELNFNVPKVREILNLTFIDSTRFVPDCIRIWTNKYNVMPIVGSCLSRDYFGPSNDLIDSRMVLGKLSSCISTDTIISLRNELAMKNDEDNEEKIPNILQKYERFTLHYVTEYETYIPLAYNPLENPIIL